MRRSVSIDNPRLPPDKVVGPVGQTLPRSSTSNATLRFASREVGAGVSAQSNPPAHSESGCRHAALECLAAISGETLVTYEKPVYLVHNAPTAVGETSWGTLRNSANVRTTWTTSVKSYPSVEPVIECKPQA